MQNAVDHYAYYARCLCLEAPVRITIGSLSLILDPLHNKMDTLRYEKRQFRDAKASCSMVPYFYLFLVVVECTDRNTR